MTLLIGIHLQEPVNSWTEAVQAMPERTPFELFQTESASEARQHNPHLFTVKRHMVHHQQPYLFATDKPNAARTFLNTFVDGTFASHAHNISAICELNEYFGGESYQELLQKIEWARTIAAVWATEYRSRPELEHIQLVLARTAVGNDIPLEVAKAASEHDCILSYHPYVPVRHNQIFGVGNATAYLNELGAYERVPESDQPIEGEILFRLQQEKAVKLDDGISPNELYFSMRWAEMDKQFVQAGYRVKWLFTEAGSVGYHLHENGDLSLHANDGWRHPDVHHGDLEAYISAMEWWVGKVAQWNVNHEHRALGGVLFTTNRSSGWEYFRLEQPALGQMMTHFANWQPPVIYPPDPQPVPNKPFATRLWEAAQAQQLVRLNSTAALQKHARIHGYTSITSNEFPIMGDDQSALVAQRFQRVDMDDVMVAFTRIGDYTNIQHIIYQPTTQREKVR